MDDDLDINRLFSDAQREADQREREEAERRAHERERVERQQRSEEQARLESQDAIRREHEARMARIDAMPAWRRWMAHDPIAAGLLIFFALLLLSAMIAAAWVFYHAN